ncbi:MAG: YqeG family HAD IIIA-type phosphatase [Ruminococcaceae bacterium]|nr:YqeG family HAD IIIA-type phosphatase [Oscillospiraceae bacterium]
MSFYPDIILSSLEEINCSFLKENNIQGLIIDLDDTLVMHGKSEIPKASQKLLEMLKSNGFSVVVMSNNTKKRAEPLCKRLDVDFVYSSRKPFLRGYRLALKKLNLPAKNICAIGDQLLSDIVGANRMGFLSVYIPPLTKKGGFTVRVKRIIERPFVKIIRKIKK